MHVGESFVAVSQREVAVLYFPENGGMIQAKKYDMAEYTNDELLERVRETVFKHGKSFKFEDVSKEPLVIAPVDRHDIEGDYLVDVRTNKQGRIDISVYAVNVLEHVQRSKTEERKLKEPELEMGM